MENYNYAVIRELVGAAFDDDGLAIFCYDNFNDVAGQFTAGQTRKARIQLLIDYVKRYGLTNRLLTGIQEANPYQYGNFESGLKSLRPGQVADQPSSADHTSANHTGQKKSETVITYNVNGASAGVIGQNARVYGGVHYHYHSPVSHQEKPMETPALSEPRPHADIKSLVHPGGAVGTDSTLYIKRAADEEVSAGISRHRGLVTVRGARQTGKTSLIMQVYVNTRDSDISLRPVFVDFQALPHSDFESLNAIWKAVANETENQLGLDPETWDHGIRYDRNLLRLSDRVFGETDTPVLFCLDEADRVFSSPVKSDFFASVRAFYNRGAFDNAWKNVRWLLSTSSEPAFFIEDMTQSPFNIGLRVELASFTFDETRDFAGRCGLSPDSDMLGRIMDYTGGHPFLVHLLFYHMALDHDSFECYMDAGTAGNNIFSGHLRRFLAQFQKEPELAAAMKKVIKGKGCRDVRMADRLEAAGLITRDASQKPVCLCSLYADYFSREL